MNSLSASRRRFLGATLGAAAATSCLPVFGKKAGGAAPPSLLLILADQLPAGALGCYGNAAVKTPNLDLLARRGVRFQNALASSRGGAVGRATLLTGRTPMQHGVTGSSTPIGPNEVLLTDLLAGEEYDVGFVGAWGLGNDKRPGHGIRWSYVRSDDSSYLNGESAQDSGEPAAILTRRAVQFLNDQKPESKPFFLTISHSDSPDAAAIDGQLPSLIAKLQERGLTDSTMIVFTSTGGRPESLRLPLIYSWPAHTPVEGHPPELVGSYDFLPTICDATAAIVPDRNLCGRSYYAAVAGKSFPKKHPWKPMTYGSFGNADAASDNRYKLILRENEKGASQLFDMIADPKQETNQFGNRSFIAARDELRRNLLDWKGKYAK